MSAQSMMHSSVALKFIDTIAGHLFVQNCGLHSEINSALPS